MSGILEYLRFLGAYFRDLWNNTRFGTLQFGRVRDVVVILAILGGVFALGLIARKLSSSLRRKRAVVLPAFLGKSRDFWLRRARVAGITAGILLGILCYAVALSDPVEPFASRKEVYPGQQIVLITDCSGSMTTFVHIIKEGKILKPRSGKNEYYSAIEASKYFVQIRKKKGYEDQIGVVIFSDFAYTLSPFTNDYDNLLMSLRLLGDSTVFRKMPCHGTRILLGMEEGMKLFQLFGRLKKTTGNAYIFFSDGWDTGVEGNISQRNRIIATSLEHHIPLYFIRTGPVVFSGPSEKWAEIARLTGGEFYVASNEEDLVAAIHDIDKKVAGTVEEKKYGSRVPRYELFTVCAIGIWALVIVLVAALRQFRTFP